MSKLNRVTPVEWLKNPRLVWRFQEGDLEATISARRWLPFALLLGLLAWYLLSPSVTAALCLAVLAGMLAWAYLWARGMALRLRGRRELQYYAMQVGDELEEQVILTNTSGLPVLWVELLDRSDLPGYTLSSARGLGANSEMDWRVHTICTRRGVFNLGPWQLVSGDPFNFFQVRQVYTLRKQILVYPPLAALPADFLASRSTSGDDRPLRQPLKAETIDCFSVREYQHGDPLHHIHWPTTARKGAPYVKLFEPLASSRVWLLPDLDPQSQYGEGDESSEETIILAAASLADRLLRDKLTVGVFSGGDSPSVLPPQGGEASLWPILECLALLHPQPGLSLARGLGQLDPLLKPNDLLLPITASLEPDWPLAMQRLLHGRAHPSATVLLLDPLSFGGAGSAEAFLPSLHRAGLGARLIHKGEIQALTAAYGALSRWEFESFGTGRVIVRQRPHLQPALKLRS